MTKAFPLNLYHKPIQDLNLPAETTTFLLMNGIVSVGDCLDFFLARKWSGTTLDVADSMRYVMDGEVINKLRDTEYWSIISDEKEL